MDLGICDVTIGEEPITDLRFFDHSDIMEQPSKTDTLTFSDHKGLSASCINISR